MLKAHGLRVEVAFRNKIRISYQASSVTIVIQRSCVIPHDKHLGKLQWSFEVQILTLMLRKVKLSGI